MAAMHPPHPHRLVPLQGASNFRDLGGYPGHQGRAVRWRRLYRSDHLGQLTAGDLTELQQRGVTLALDFRGVQESTAASYYLAGLKRQALPIEPTVVQRMQKMAAAGQQLDASSTAGLMEELYRNIVRHQTAALAAFFGHLLAHQPSQHAALVFHCTAGKDRTGVAAALLLLALGVPRDVVMQDFLLTNACFRHPPPLNKELPDDVRQVLWSVRPQYLQAALQVIDDEHGSVAAYLRSALSLGQPARDELMHRYLEPS